MMVYSVHTFGLNEDETSPEYLLFFFGTQNIPYHIDFLCDAKQQEHCQKIQKRDIPTA